MKSIYISLATVLLAINRPGDRPGVFDTKFNYIVYHTGVNKDTTVQFQQFETLSEQYQKLQKSYTRIQYAWVGTTVFFLLLLIIGIHLELKRRLDIKKIRNDKDTFVKDLIAEYDHKIIQLMIVKADYEEIIKNQGKDPDEK